MESHHRVASREETAALLFFFPRTYVLMLPCALGGVEYALILATVLRVKESDVQPRPEGGVEQRCQTRYWRDIVAPRGTGIWSLLDFSIFDIWKRWDP